MNRKKLARFAVLFLLLAMVAPTGVSAYASYTTYIYNNATGFGGGAYYTECPDAYVPESRINSETIGLYYLRDQGIDTPQDMFVDNENKIYIADTKNDRIVVLKPDGSFDMILNNFVNEWGVPDSLAQPKGVFANTVEIFVADTAKNRLVVFKKDGTFDRIIPQPESEVFPENHVYTPIAVAVDNAGRIYVVSSTTFQGIIAMSIDGTFQAFMGAQRGTMSAWAIFWRNFQTKEMRQRTQRNVSTEYNNITLDADGFLYATTSSIDEDAQMGAMRDKKSEYAPVKKLNPQGTDIMRRSASIAPAGEWFVNFGREAKGASKIIDVAVGPEGTWSIIDEKRSKVFTYDQDGRNIFNFGDYGTQFGTIQSIQAVAYQGTKMLLLDKTTNSITVYKRTEYGDLLVGGAIKNHNDRLYDKAVDDWQEVLKRNNNLDLAYVGIGKAFYREGLYLDAMDQFQYAIELNAYSDAFREYRKLWIEKYVLIIPLVIAIVVIGVGFFLRHANKVNKRDMIRGDRQLKYGSHMLYGFYIIFHPFDGFWDMKHEKRGSLAAATTYLVLTCAAFIYRAVGEGYIVNPWGLYSDFTAEAVGVIVPVALWCIANWCLTTLFDGEGSLKDIYMVTCYSLIPLLVLITVNTLLTNIVTREEMSLVSMITTLGFIWMGALLFFGIMVVHDYSLGKNVVTSLGTIVGMAFIMFVLVLFSALLIKMVSFINGIYLEVSYRV